MTLLNYYLLLAILSLILVSLQLDLVTPVVVVGYMLGLYGIRVLSQLSLVATSRISLTVLLFRGLRVAERLLSWLHRHNLLLTLLILVHAVLADLLTLAARD